MTELVCLHHEEGVAIDGRQLALLIEEMGANGAERMINAATRELAARLAEMKFKYETGEILGMGRDSKRMARIASEMGMTSFALVASDVQLCAARGDMVGCAATWARLVRVANESLDQITGLASYSGRGA